MDTFILASDSLKYITSVSLLNLKAETAFKEFVKIRKSGHRYSATCTKGLFQISAPTKEIAIREARHYFIQYYIDGEYGD